MIAIGMLLALAAMTAVSANALPGGGIAGLLIRLRLPGSDSRDDVRPPAQPSGSPGNEVSLSKMGFRR